MAGGVEKYKTKVSVSFDGNNTWMAPAMFQSICDIDIQYFPFDEQKCHLKFASWAYDVSKLDVFLNDKETGRLEGIYQPSNEWILLSVDAERNEVSSDRHKYCFYLKPSSVVLAIPQQIWLKGSNLKLSVIKRDRPMQAIVSVGVFIGLHSHAPLQQMLFWQVSTRKMLHQGLDISSKKNPFLTRYLPWIVMIPWVVVVERAKRERAWKSPHARKGYTRSRGVIFTHFHVSLALLSLRENGGLLVVYHITCTGFLADIVL